MAKKIKSVPFEQALKFNEQYLIKPDVQKNKTKKKKNDYKITEREEEKAPVIDITELLKEEE